MVGEEVEPVVGDVQGASDRREIGGSERADKSDVLTTAADTFTLQHWHLDGPLSFPARYFQDGLRTCTWRPGILKKVRMKSKKHLRMSIP